MPTNTLLLGAAAIAVAALLTGCVSTAADPAPEAATSSPVEPIVVTYDGGLLVLDGETLEVASDLPLDGFLRVNTAGDDTHVAVTTSEGFRLLDAVEGELTDVVYEGAEPGHVVTHADSTVFFFDGSGEAVIAESDDVADGAEAAKTYTAAAPHHGVAVQLDDGTLVVTAGTDETRSGAIAVDADGAVIASSEECAGIHGEAVAAGEVAAFGCADGILLYSDGAFVKVAAPAAFGQAGTLKGSAESSIILSDHFVDEGAEFERPNQFALVNTEAATMSTVALPEGVSYSFRSLARGAHGEAYVLGTDGSLYVIDAETGEITDTWAVVGAWEEPEDWQQARPSVFARGHDIFVTDPSTKSVHRIDYETGEVLATATLDAEPNEIAGVATEHAH